MQYRKKAQTVEAWRYKGIGRAEIVGTSDYLHAVLGAPVEPTPHFAGACAERTCQNNGDLFVITPTQRVTLKPGDFLIRDSIGAWSVCEAKVFAEDYTQSDGGAVKI
jgi:hypothetical protein